MCAYIEEADVCETMGPLFNFSIQISLISGVGVYTSFSLLGLT